MATTRWGADDGTPYETWLKFINGPGWSPSMVSVDGQIVDGVTAVTETWETLQSLPDLPA